MNAAENITDGWPEDEQPIFTDNGFGAVSQTESTPDELGEAPWLSGGRIVPADASATEFAEAWAGVSSKATADHLRWEFAIQSPATPGGNGLTPLPLPKALERLRLDGNARLFRRPIGDWAVAPTPFPRVLGAGWKEEESRKLEWYRVFIEFPPSYWGVIARQGGVEHVPADWPLFARRAATSGLTPSTYAMLGTALLAQRTRAQQDQQRGTVGPTPPLTEIEVWHDFPKLLESGVSPLAAIAHICRALAA
ncbi:hypothetical protein [Microbacterium sp. A84]|uniref:hypothetical protein n=1 Tax=Microbacterium sp. A84 TaxID=3450715 RepID=UPI003F42EA65